ncbi:hypothetical protein PO124_14585 [Bacillus licheniformis]|nr:hypothetical protein [Bacillus licheniformis]
MVIDEVLRGMEPICLKMCCRRCSALPCFTAGSSPKSFDLKELKFAFLSS